MGTLKELSEQAGVRGVVIDYHHANMGEAWVTLKLDEFTALAERAQRYEAALRDAYKIADADVCEIIDKALEQR